MNIIVCYSHEWHFSDRYCRKQQNAVCLHISNESQLLCVNPCVCVCQLPALAACRADTIMVVVGWPETKDCEEVGETSVPWGVVITRPAKQGGGTRDSTVSTAHGSLGVCWHASHTWMIRLWQQQGNWQGVCMPSENVLTGQYKYYFGLMCSSLAFPRVWMA